MINALFIRLKKAFILYIQQNIRKSLSPRNVYTIQVVLSIYGGFIGNMCRVHISNSELFLLRAYVFPIQKRVDFERRLPKMCDQRNGEKSNTSIRVKSRKIYRLHCVAAADDDRRRYNIYETR